MDDVLVFNMTAMRPACVLLAVAMGGNPEFAKMFDSDSWIIDGPEVAQLRRFGSMTPALVRRIADHLGIAA